MLGLEHELDGNRAAPPQITQIKVDELRRLRPAPALGRHTGRELPPTISTDEPPQDDVNRRELLRLLSLAGSLMTVPLSLEPVDVDRVAHAAKRPSSLDPATLDSYATVNRNLWHTYSKTANKSHVMPAVREHLGAVVTNLQHSQSTAARTRLSLLAGDLFQLCGEIFFDGDRYPDAAQCYSLAATASKEARAFDLWACAMTRHAFVGIYENQYRDAAVLLEGAQRLAANGDPNQATRHWVAAVQAQAHAGLGDFEACQRALDRAEQVHQLAPATKTSSGWLRFEGSRLDEERGACYVQLGRPQLAEPALNKALGRPISIRRRGSVLTDLARVGAQRGDVDQVLMFGAAALDVMRQTGSAGYVGRKLTALPQHIEPFLGDRHIRYLINQIKTTAAMPTVATMS